uniref:Uncharacterized protein n=1 Tax=Romanomermis culicivorax TaxID=13658 RepID=A0A915IBE1_ROMCU
MTQNQSKSKLQRFKMSEKFGTSEYKYFRQIVEKAEADNEFLGCTRSQTKLKALPGNDDVEAKPLEATVIKAMDKATKAIRDKLEKLKLKIEEMEGHNEANMRQLFLCFSPFQMFNAPPPFSGNFGETFLDWIEKLAHLMTLQDTGDHFLKVKGKEWLNDEKLLSGIPKQFKCSASLLLEHVQPNPSINTQHLAMLTSRIEASDLAKIIELPMEQQKAQREE